MFSGKEINKNIYFDSLKTDLESSIFQNIQTGLRFYNSSTGKIFNIAFHNCEIKFGEAFEGFPAFTIFKNKKKNDFLSNKDKFISRLDLVDATTLTMYIGKVYDKKTNWNLLAFVKAEPGPVPIDYSDTEFYYIKKSIRFNSFPVFSNNKQLTFPQEKSCAYIYFLPEHKDYLEYDKETGKTIFKQYDFYYLQEYKDFDYKKIQL